MLGLFAWLIAGLTSNILNFASFPVATIVTLNYVENLSFPAITICNYNQWRASYIKDSDAELLKLMFPSLQTSDSDIDWSDYDFTERNITADIIRGAHQKEDMIIECSWKNISPCSHENFTMTITDFGVCYTFNQPSENSKALMVKQTGSDYGLSLRLNVEQGEYLNGNNKGAGFKILTHPQGVFPFVKQLGFAVSPGFETLVSLKFTKLKNLPGPYEFKCLEKKLKYAAKYTVEACQTECRVDYIIDKCGCKNYNMPGNVRVCYPKEIYECVKPVSANYTREGLVCNCPIPCLREVYQSRVSSAFWPAQHITKELQVTLNQTEEHIRKNYLDLVIYFEELSFEEIRQVAAYDASTLQSDIGGYMGLLLGASAITVCELIDFVIINLVDRVRRRREKKMRGLLEIKEKHIPTSLA
ncbi:acid-sensing ion channel 2-like [Anneissia japonica]|uniref:acid-sensing ion channel 2-like n=1 Tax=Anneissia japonica TaxID=1529436 RepID=UPI0014258291|nr:acid-sensing ion channel 2-like [Anneissia japonica]